MEPLETDRDIYLLDSIDNGQDTPQVSMTARTGVVVGTENWYLRRFIENLFIRAKSAELPKLRYVIKPSGIALRARLIIASMENPIWLFRERPGKTSPFLKNTKSDASGEFA